MSGASWYLSYDGVVRLSGGVGWEDLATEVRKGSQRWVISVCSNSKTYLAVELLYFEPRNLGQAIVLLHKSQKAKCQRRYPQICNVARSCLSRMFLLMASKGLRSERKVIFFLQWIATFVKRVRKWSNRMHFSWDASSQLKVIPLITSIATARRIKLVSSRQNTCCEGIPPRSSVSRLAALYTHLLRKQKTASTGNRQISMKKTTKKAQY